MPHVALEHGSTQCGEQSALIQRSALLTPVAVTRWR